MTLLAVAVAENVRYRQVSIYGRVREMISKATGIHARAALERNGFAADSGGTP